MSLFVPAFLARNGPRQTVKSAIASHPSLFVEPLGSQTIQCLRRVSTFVDRGNNTATVLKRVLTRRAQSDAQSTSPITNHHSLPFIPKPRDKVVTEATWAEIDALIQAGSIQQAQSLLKSTCWNPQTQLPQSIEGWRIQLEIYRITKNHTAAFAAIYEELPRCGLRPTVSVFESAIVACCASKVPDQALQLLRDMQRRNFEPTDRCHTAVLRCLVKCDRFEEALNMFKQLSRGGRKNSSAQYHVFMEYYIQRGDGKRAVALMEEMMALNLPPSVASVAMLAQFGLTKSPQLTKEQIIESMQRFEHMCDYFKLTNWGARKAAEFFYAFLLDIILAHPELPKQLTNTICFHARARRVVFSSVFLNAAMTAYIDAGLLGNALGLFQMYVQRRVFIGGAHYVESSGDLSKRTRCIRPDDKTLRLLIRIAQLREQPNMAMYYWNFFTKRKIATSSSSLSALITVLSQFGEVEKAAQMAASSNHDVDSNLMAGLMNLAVATRNHDVAEELILSAKHRGLPITSQLGTSLIEYYDRAGKVDEAYEVWQQMKQAKCVTPRAAGTLIRLVGQHAGIAHAEAIHDEYLSLGYRPTRRFTYMMLRTYAWIGSFDQAVLYLNRAQNELGMPPTLLHLARMMKEAGRQMAVGPLFQMFEYIYRRPDFVFTMEFCRRVIFTYANFRVGGAQAEDCAVAHNWLRIAAKPQRINGGKLVHVLEGADRTIFFQMVQGWANIALHRQVPADARPAPPVMPTLVREQQLLNPEQRVAEYDMAQNVR